MRLLHLNARDFRSWQELDLDLSGVRTAAVLGHNGAGKSSLLRAIAYALGGEGRGEETLIRDDASSMRVQLTVEQAGSEWVITRGRERGKGGWVTLERDGAQLGSRTIAETQQTIDEHVRGMDSDAFNATLYAAQGQTGMLAALTPGRRKELLADLLGLGRYADWRSSASGQASAAAGRLDEHDALVQRLQERRAELGDVDAAAHTAAEAVAAADERMEAAEAQVQAAEARRAATEKVRLRAQLVARMSDLKHRAIRSEEAEQRRRRLAGRLQTAEPHAEAAHRRAEVALDRERERVAEHNARAANAAEHLKGLQMHARMAAERFSRAQLDVERARRQHTDAEAAVARLQGAEVPTCTECGQALHADALARATTEARDRVAGAAQAILDAQPELAAADEAFAGAKAAAEAAPADAAQRIEPDRELVAALAAARTELATVGKMRAEHDALPDPEDITALRAEFAQLRQQASDLPEDIPDGPDPATAQAQRRNAEQDRRTAAAALARAQAAAEAAAGVDEELAGLLDAREPKARRVAALQLLGQAFGSGGIPALILDNATGAMQAAANDALEQLGARMRVRLATQRQNRKGSHTETLDIVVSDGAIEQPLERFSGGEQYRVHIALRLALAATLARSGAASCDILLLDEPTDLDEEGMAALGRLLPSMPQQTLVVSHSERLTDALPTSLRISGAAGHGPSALAVA